MITDASAIVRCDCGSWIVRGRECPVCKSIESRGR